MIGIVMLVLWLFRMCVSKCLTSVIYEILTMEKTE